MNMPFKVYYNNKWTKCCIENMQLPWGYTNKINKQKNITLSKSQDVDCHTDHKWLDNVNGGLGSVNSLHMLHENLPRLQFLYNKSRIQY